MTKTIDITIANREFSGPVAVGEYVAWWISDDRQVSMPMTMGSMPTEDECADEANRLLDTERDADGRDLLESGSLVIELVTEA